MTIDTDAASLVLRALRRTRQIRQFTGEPVDPAAVQEILEVARWTGSSMNSQPWTFITIHDRSVLDAIAAAAQYARHVRNAPMAIAIVMPGEDAESEAYDEGRAAERILIAAHALGLGAGIGWAQGDEQHEAVRRLLGVEAPAFVRTIISLGHPTEQALRPRSAPGTARRPLSEIVRER
jgi:nitroreductase